jgi:acyl carrier protein
MVPSVFILLDALPLSQSGKIDHQALPLPDHGRPELDSLYVAPSTDLEQVVAETWARVLGVERVGIHDNFFELGGHSLLATRVVSRLKQALQIEIPLQGLFESPTVAMFSRVVIANETVSGQAEKTARILKTIRGMSPEEVKKALEEKVGFEGSES